MSFICLSKFVSASSGFPFVFSMSQNIFWSHSSVKFLPASLSLRHLHLFHHSHLYYLFPFFIPLNLFSEINLAAHLESADERHFHHPHTQLFLLSFNLLDFSLTSHITTFHFCCTSISVGWFLVFSCMLGKCHMGSSLAGMEAAHLPALLTVCGRNNMDRDQSQLDFWKSDTIGHRSWGVFIIYFVICG